MYLEEKGLEEKESRRIIRIYKTMDLENKDLEEQDREEKGSGRIEIWKNMDLE